MSESGQWESVTEQDRDRIFKSLMLETELLNKGVVSVIENTRRLVLSATYIAGFGVPVIATLLKDGNLNETVKTKLFLFELICLGEAITSLAIFYIYVGNFWQIFITARYLREHIEPAIRKLAPSSPVELFHWERWQQERRNRKSWFTLESDAQLLAEPAIMTFYAASYCAGLLLLEYGYGSHFGWVLFLVCIILGLCARCFTRVILILRDASKST